MDEMETNGTILKNRASSIDYITFSKTSGYGTYLKGYQRNQFRKRTTHLKTKLQNLPFMDRKYSNSLV